MNTIPTIPITPLDVMRAYCNGETAALYADLLLKLSAIGARKDDSEIPAIASGYYVHLSILAIKGHPDSDEVQCHDLMREDDSKPIPEILWDINDCPPSTAWFTEFQQRFDATIKRLKAKDWTVVAE